MKTKQNLNKFGRRTILAPFRWCIVQSVVLFTAAGTLKFPKAWLYLSLILLTSLISAMIMWKIIPELANQRGSMKSDTKSWDKVLVPVFILLSLLITPLVCGLDRGRFQWSEPGIGYTITGVVLIMIAYVIQTWAMIVNTHFEGTVRIQHDREHKVISSGPYSIIRHPGYSAMIVTSFAIPMIIGSIYGLIPGFIVAVILVIRTNFEDNTLKNELDGYNEYAHRVKYRLLKWVW